MHQGKQVCPQVATARRPFLPTARGWSASVACSRVRETWNEKRVLLTLNAVLEASPYKLTSRR